jgi:hypothetical protein
VSLFAITTQSESGLAMEAAALSSVMPMLKFSTCSEKFSTIEQWPANWPLCYLKQLPCVQSVALTRLSMLVWCCHCFGVFGATKAR